MKYLLIFTSFLLTMCTKPKTGLYVIEKGNHYANNRRLVKTDGLITFNFTFTNDHKYQHIEKSDHINKLFGLTSIQIHKNSARIGYKEDATTGEFKVYAYYYQDGVRATKLLYKAKTYEIVNITIDTRFGYYFFVNGNTLMVNGKKCKYIANPYFGGHPTAPKEFLYKIDL
jgi:hypothetical protein